MISVDRASAMVEDLCAGPPDLHAQAFFERREAFAGFLAGTAISTLLNNELQALASDPTRFPARSSKSIWTLGSGSAASLLIARLPSHARYNGVHLQGSSCHRLLSVLSARANLLIYRHEHGDAARFDPSNALSAPEQRTLNRGDVVALEAWREVSEWQPVATVTLSVALVSRTAVAQHWIYQRDTLQPRELVSATYELNRLQYALELLAEIGDASQAATTAALFDHPAHHIRWAALKATLDLDETLGRALLQRALDDAHPHVARAAAAGLRALTERAG